MATSLYTLLALVIGLALGITLAEFTPVLTPTLAATVDPIGTLWLNALKMTVIPLIVALLITGVAQTAVAARAGRITRYALGCFAALLITSAVISALVTPLLLSVWPVDGQSAAALRSAVTGQAAVKGSVDIGVFLLNVIPANVFEAAATNAVLPLIIFTTIFAFAVVRLPDEQRASLLAFFLAIQNAMLIIVGWVLALAPIGVSALAFVVASRIGIASIGALLHYILIVSAVGVVLCLGAYGLAVIGGAQPLGRFVRAILPAQTVAISTQSSMASLPAMLRAVQALGLHPETGAVVLPLAVALFRVTGPAMNLAVAIYVAYWFGTPPGSGTLAIGVGVAALTTLGAVSLPGQITFVTSIAPICLAMGLPIEPLGLLIAVETLPDIMRTLGNVTMDVAVTTVVDRHAVSDDRLTPDPDI